MKTAILLATFAWLSFHSFAQYSRSVYSDDTQTKRHSSLFTINGEATIISLRESSNDTLRVMLIDIDENGETDNYRMYEHSPFDISIAFALSGVGVNSSGEVTMSVLKQNVNNSISLKYLTIDPASGNFSNEFSINGLYRRAFSSSRVKGDSLITYVANFSTTGISRVAKSLSTTGTTTELALSNVTFNGNLFQGQKSCDLVINGSDEYVFTSDRIMKRNSPNNYIETSYPGVLYAPTATFNSSGELFVLHNYNGDYILLDANLNTTGSGNIPELQGNLTSQSEIYSLPNNELRIWANEGTASRIVDISSSYSVLNNKTSRNIPMDQFILDGKQYLIGYEFNHSSFVNKNGIPFQSGASNVTVVYDDLISDVAEFIEYDQVLTSGNIEFHTNHLSRSFTNSQATAPGFSYEQNGLKRPLIYSASSNIIGSTINGTLQGTTNTYEPTQTAGPYCDPGSYSLEVMDKYNRGYYVTRDMIEQHLFEITIGSQYYEMPFGIREWPAHGDVSLGQAANLADFVDLNVNGIYEPELGDYPAIYGDQCLLNVYHQNPGTPNSASIETHQYYFTFDCDTSEALENAVFIRTHNFARSQTFFNTYEGDYVDFDLGNPFDDYIGTNVELAMTYCYNGDAFDENNSGVIGFQDTMPAVGMLALQGLKLDEDNIDNYTIYLGNIPSNGIGFSDGLVDNEYYTMESSYDYHSVTAPNGISEWYNIMQGKNSDWSPKIINGVEVRHDYFGSSDPLFYTSYGSDHGNNHTEEGLSNPSGDRRMSSASGPSIFAITDTMVFLKAYLVGVDTANLSQYNSRDKLFELGQELRDFYSQNATSCGNTFDSYISSSTLAVEEETLEQILVYPNPANQHIQFKGIAGTATLDIFDLNGRIVLSEQDIDDNRSIDISGLDKAIYLIQIHDENGSQTIRMIKQ